MKENKTTKRKGSAGLDYLMIFSIIACICVTFIVFLCRNENEVARNYEETIQLTEFEEENCYLIVGKEKYSEKNNYSIHFYEKTKYGNESIKISIDEKKDDISYIIVTEKEDVRLEYSCSAHLKGKKYKNDAERVFRFYIRADDVKYIGS